MAQMQPSRERRPDHAAVAAKEAYEFLMAYDLEIKEAEEALAAQNHQAALSHLLLAANCASAILNWSATQKALLGFAKRVKETTVPLIMAAIGGGEPPYGPNTILELLKQWLTSGWLAKLIRLTGGVAAGLGAESYHVQAGLPAGVSITIVFPAAKSDSPTKKATRAGTSASMKEQKRR
jgi:hypothetical protein